jgi:aminoglycoside 3-N-acetyltransferase
MFETLSGLAVRYLPRKRLTRLRNLYLGCRRAANPLLRRIYGNFDTNDLREHLEQQLDRDFDVLMVHSSVNNMYPMYNGNPLEIVRMLIEFCGPDRTLAMPAFYFGDPAIGGPVEVFKQNPRFDLRRTPSQMGLVTELFRRSKGVVCSRHPVYRVCALGALAEILVEGHEHAVTPSGVGTPFDAMTRYKTLIIGIGKPSEVLTQVHHAEDVMGDDFPVPRETTVGEPLQIMLVEGDQEIRFTMPNGGGLKWKRNMFKLRKIMDRDKLREWKFHNVPLFATYASDVSDAIMNAAKEGITIYDKPQSGAATNQG